MELWLIAQGPTGRARHVAVDSPPDRSLREVVGELAAYLGVPPSSSDHPLSLYCERLGVWLPNDQPLKTSGLRQGDRVAVAPRPSSAPPPAGRALFDLVVVEGRLAGVRVGLGEGPHVIGRGEDADVRLDEPSVSGGHLEVRVTGDRVVVIDNDSTNGTQVGGQRLRAGEERAVEPGEQVVVGRVPIVFEVRPDVREAGLREEDGWLLFNRPPRRTQPFRPAHVVVPAPPADPAPARLPLASAVLPLVAGAVLWLVTKNPVTLVFVALSPVMVVGSAVESWRRGKRGFSREAVKFRARLQDARREIEAARANEAAARTLAAPAPGDLCRSAEQLATSVWERRPEDDDFLSLRVGTAEQDSSIQVAIEEGGSEQLRAEAEKVAHGARRVPGAPVVAALRDGVLGLSGPEDHVTMLVRWLVVQAATLHSPRDLVLLAAVPDAAVDDWAWLKWLPQARPVARAERRLAAGQKEARTLIAAAVRLLEQRSGAGDRAGRAARFIPAVIMVLHEDVVPDRGAVGRLLSEGPAHAITCVWIARAPEDVPGECRLLAELSEDGSALAFADLVRGETIPGVTPDGLGMRPARSAAGSLAPLRDPVARTRGAEIPERVGLFETLGVSEVTPASLLGAWSNGAEALRTAIGITADGPFTIDLRADGPHGLVGGTSGAGKSELLQAVVAGLACAYPPERVSFLLIDYKGGAAFRECASLPHTAGLVTDLDESLSERALESLRAELRRRERYLRERGVASLAELEQVDPAPGLPNLVIVVDEFATLVSEIPAFVDGIVDVAQRGRSLGIHLLLATQRPRGALNASILANTNLRIALRVTDPSESTDVIDVPDAARIPRSLPGRAMARTEQGDVTEFQSALASAPAQTIIDLNGRVRVSELGFGGVVGTREADTPTPTSARTTQLAQVVEAARAAAGQRALARPAAPWLPPLPETLALADGRLEAADVAPGAAVLGLLDEPAEQRQRPFVVDLAAEGSLLVYGASGSGKTTLLRTLAADLARRNDPSRVHLYAIDFAAQDLAPLAALPHCGGVVTSDEPERVLRLFAMLEHLLAERRGTPREAAGPDWPQVVVVLDGYAGFAASFERAGAELLDTFQRLVADGRPLGVHTIVTADRRGAVPPAISGRIQRKIVLRMADHDEFAALGVPAKRARRELPPGRGFVDGLEVQIAHVGQDSSAAAQAAGLREVAGEAATHGGAGAPKVTLLPEALPREELPGASGLLVPLAVGENRMEPVALDLRNTNFLVIGPRRSGRTTALETAARSLLAQQMPPTVHVLAPRRSSLGDLVGVASTARGTAECEESAARLAAGLERRGPEDPPVVVVVDDGDELVEGAAALPLLALVRQGRDSGLRVLAAVERNSAHRAFGNWIRELRNDGHGLLLRPEVDVDGELLSCRLPRSFRREFPAGRGYLVEGGGAELVQVARE